MNLFPVSQRQIAFCISLSFLCFISCEDPTPVCDSISISTLITDSGCDQNIGSIEVSTTGGQTPFTYKLDNGTFQSGTTFNQLEGGVYEVVAKDGQGCEVDEQVIVSNGLTYVADIKSIIQTNCAISGCHVSGRNVTDFTIDDNAVSRAQRIKEQTSSRNMPESSSGLALTDEEIEKIACWADGGGPK